MTATLADLKAGQTATVAGYAHEDQHSSRLMQFGIIEGAEIEILRRAPTGDPIEIRVMGYALSLRASEARVVLVTTSDTA